MNRLKMFVVITALLMGSSALASAEEYHNNIVSLQVRLGDHDRDRDRGRDRDDHFRRDYDDHRRYDNDYWRFDARYGWVRR